MDPKKDKDDILTMVSEFNESVRTSITYDSKRYIPHTKVVFFDEESDPALPMSGGDSNWATISAELGELIAKSGCRSSMVDHQRREGAELYITDENRTEWHLKILEFLKLLTAELLGMMLSYNKRYEEEDRKEKKEKIHSLIQTLNQNPESVVACKDIYHHCMSEVNGVHQMVSKKMKKLAMKEAKAKRLLDTIHSGQYSVKNTCKLCKVSTSTYYEAIAKEKYYSEHRGEIKRPKATNRDFTDAEIAYIKEMADNPNESYTVPDMRRKLLDKHDILRSRGCVRYHITKTLGYSWQKNRYKPKCAFGRGQTFLQFEVAKSMLNFNAENKVIICIDETSLGSIKGRNYSYSKKGNHPHRAQTQYTAGMGVIMAITNLQIFAFQMCSDGFESLSFASFLISLSDKILKMGRKFASSVVIFMDNAPFHKSLIAMKLYKILPFTFFFNAPYWSDFNPIETVFSFVKSSFCSKPCINQ
jgi:hypothetical protein